MPQTAKSTNKKARSRNGASPRSSSSTRNGSAKRSTSQRAGSSRTRAKQGSSSTRARSKSTRARPKPRSSAQPKNGTAAFASAISEAASKAKTPLIAGGTALVGAAAGAVVKDRLERSQSKGPLRRLRGISIPKPGGRLNLANLDLEKVKSAADRVSAYGQQASDIASAAEKTRKKNK